MVARAPLSVRIAELLDEQRLRLGMTQTELSRRVGLSQGQVSKMLRGRNEFTIDQVADFCAALDMDILRVVRAALRG